MRESLSTKIEIIKVCHSLLPNPKFFSLLLQIDADEAAKVTSPPWDDEHDKPATKLPKTFYELPLGKLASEWFQREMIPSDFVLPGFIAGTLGALIAPGSTGKSMLAMQLAALFAGADTIGAEWKLKVGDVLSLAVEDPENELYNRWTNLGSRMSPEERKAGERVRFVPMLGQRFDINRYLDRRHKDGRGARPGVDISNRLEVAV